MKGGGFFRRAFVAALAPLVALGGQRPTPVVTSHSSAQASVPQPPSKTPAPSGISARKLQDRAINTSNMWRGYATSQVIPPFKFCHGRTMVARYPRLRGS